MDIFLTRQLSLFKAPFKHFPCGYLRGHFLIAQELSSKSRKFFLAVIDSTPCVIDLVSKLPKSLHKYDCTATGTTDLSIGKSASWRDRRAFRNCLFLLYLRNSFKISTKSRGKLK